MKKMIALVLTLLCLFAFMGCEVPQQNEGEHSSKTAVPETTKSEGSISSENKIPETIDRSGQDDPINNTEISSFSEFLARENFKAAIGQGEFIDQLGKYTYEGEKITDIVPGLHYDSNVGGGIFASGEMFGYFNDFYRMENGYEYTNSFYTKVALEGLDLPYGIGFDDCPSTAFEKIGVKEDPISNFVADHDSETDMTLYKDDTSTLTFRNRKLTSEPVEYDISYEIIYNEKAPVDLENGKTVERTIKLMFGLFSNALERFEVTVCEKQIKNDKYRLIIQSDYPIVNQPESSYAAGDRVVIQLETVTEHYYVLMLNYNELAMNEEMSDMNYTYFTFTMPDRDVVITIDCRAVEIPVAPNKNVIVENGEQYLVLPISGEKLRIRSEYRSHLDKIDDDLLKKAEEMISGYLSSYPENSGIYLGMCDGKLCLCAEVIVDIDPPNTTEGGPSSGCGIDHDHYFFNEPIAE